MSIPSAAVDHALRVLFPTPDPYANDPVAWNTDRRRAFLWSKQREIAESVRDHRYTAVHACHDAGKSWLAASIIAWWVDTHPPDEVFVVWTAPTYPQVNAIIGRELRDAIDTAGLNMTLNGDNHLYVGGRLVGYGRKPADSNMAAFQGIHAKYVLVVIDEGCGVVKPMWDAADALVTNEHARMLAVGNPDDPTSHFANVCNPQHDEHKGWNVIGIDGLQSPNFTGESVPEKLRPLLLSQTWVEERKDRWGENSSLYVAKVRGQFPVDAEDAIIPGSFVARARNRTDPVSFEDDPVGAVLGCDIAGGGDDMSTIVELHKGHATVVAQFREPDLTRIADRIALEVQARGPLCKAVVDGDGIGQGVVNTLQRAGVPVISFRAAQKPHSKQHWFRDRKTEAWWVTREKLKDGLLVLPGFDAGKAADDLAADLSTPKLLTPAGGRIAVESKAELRKRLGRSPDLGDALVMAASVEPSRGDPNPPVPRVGRRSSPSTGLLTEPL